MNDLFQKKRPLKNWEIACLVILTPVIYILGVNALIGTEYHFPHRLLMDYLPAGLCYLIILCFDAAWVIGMRLLPLEIKRPKIILTWFILLVSAIALSDLFLIDMFNKMW